MNEPKFSIVMIAKNEANVLGRCLNSLSNFIQRGGEIILCDTGSTDNTIAIAHQYGCKVIEYSGARKELKRADVENINFLSKRYDEDKIAEYGDFIFDFSNARNHATEHAKNDFIISLDADEVYATLDIDAINSLIDNGARNISYDFVFSFRPDGTPDVQFVQSKAFDRRYFKWVNVIHEVLQGEGPTIYVPSETIRLEHHQEAGKEHRTNYIKGLAYDHLCNPKGDRNAHYYARELMYTGRYRWAIDRFRHHRNLNAWDLERNQSLIYMGDCYGYIGNQPMQEACYLDAIKELATRREGLIKLAWLYYSQKKYRHAIIYATGALSIPWTSYYSNRASHYNEEPYEILYLSYGWLGEIPKAKDFCQKCIELCPDSEKFKDHLKYYL
jgi:glycosyltransferase involved in cell wall biosynthesis